MELVYLYINLIEKDHTLFVQNNKIGVDLANLTRDMIKLYSNSAIKRD